MQNQVQLAHDFKNLHIKGTPLILVNIWDAGSAQAIAAIGSRAIATSSWAVAAAHGYEDGEQLPIDLALENLKRIVAIVNLPVTIDLEGAYGQNPAIVQETVSKAIAAGAVGINFEDQAIGHEGLYSIEEQCLRIKAAREAAKHSSVPLFINARTDIFLKRCPANQSNILIEETINRAIAYAEAGANGFFAPGLSNIRSIEKLCERSPLPINIMVLPDTPSSKQLAEIGVARISYGPSPYNAAMETLKGNCQPAFSL